MASKKPLKDDDLPLIDDFDDSFPDFDFDDGDAKSRKPGSPIKRGVKEALKSHFSRPDNYRNYVGKILPRQYGELWDDYTAVTDSVSEAVDSVKKQAQQPLNELAKNLQRGINPKHKRVHRWLKKVEESTEEYKFDKENAEKTRQAATQAAIESVFADFQQQQQDDNEAREEIEGDRFARQYVKLQSQERLLGNVARSLDHQVKFITGIELPYKRKSLELQYRVAHGIADLVELTRGLAEQQRKQLNDVVKNTALPDIQKARLSESYKQGLRNKFVDKTLGAVGGKLGASGILQGFTKNLTDSLKDATQMAVLGIEGANMAIGDQFDSNPDARKRRFAQMLAEGALGVAGPAAAGGLSKAVMRKFPKATRKVFKGARKIGYVRDNLHSELQDYANGDFTGKDAWLRDLVGFLLPGKDNDAKIERASGDRLKEVTNYDVASRKSIVDVIPGYLSRILQELQITRTGDANIKPLHFNHARGRFESQQQGIAELRRLMGKNSQKNQMHDVLAHLEKAGSSFSENDKEALSKSLLTSRRSGRTMTANSLMNPRFFQTGKAPVNEEQSKAFSQAFQKLFDAKNGRFTGSEKGERARNRFFADLAGTDSDTVNARAIIQELVDSGNGELAYAAGLLDAEGNIDTQRLYNDVAGIQAPDIKDSLSASSKRRRRGRALRINSAYTAPAAMPPIEAARIGTSKPEQSSDAYLQSSKQADLLQQQLEVIRKFSDRNHEDLASIREYVSQLNQSAGMSPIMGPPSPGGSGFMGGVKQKANSWGEKIKNAFSGNSDTNDEWKGFWNSSLKANAKRVVSGVKNAASKFKTKAGNAISVFGSTAAAMGAKAADLLSMSRIVGARKFEDFKDGIPRFGDLYIDGVNEVRITASMFKEGRLRDAEGKVIQTLAELADTTGAVFDEYGNVILSQADKLRSYVKVNGQIFARVWIDRIKRAASRTKAFGIFAGAKALAGGKIGLSVANQARKAIQAFGASLFSPPKDVYVRGESEPRLTAYLMRLGHYLNKSDGSVITRPTQIKGTVVDSEGNVLLTLADLAKGLVDSDGQPIKSILQRLTESMRTNADRTAKFGKAALSKAFSGIKTAGRLAGAFLSNGMAGVRSGAWKKSTSNTEAATTNNSSSDSSLSVLIQIRDILDGRLPGGKRAGKSWLGKKAAKAAAAQSEIADSEPTEEAQTQEASSKPGLLTKMFTGLGKLVGKAKRKWNNRKGTPQPTKAASEPTAQPTRTNSDRDGDGIRDNSAEDIRNKWKNINQPTKTLADVKQPTTKPRENTIDMIIGAITSGFSAVAGFFGNMLGGKALGGAAGAATGALGRTGGWIAQKAKGAASLMGRGVQAIAARTGGLAGLSRVGGFIGKLGAKRILGGAAAAGAAALGSPVIGTALAIGGAVWTAKEIYDYFKDDKDPVGKSDRRVLQKLRLAEYGASMKDAATHNKLLKIEELVKDSVSIQGSKATIDENSVDGSALLRIAGIVEDDQPAVNRFVKWFNNRFTPVFLKWMTIAKAARKDLDGLEDMSNDERIKVVEAASASDGWTEMTNPFGTEDLTISTKEITLLREATLDLFKTKGKKMKESGIKESIAPKDAAGEMLKSVQRQVAGGPDGGFKEEKNFRENIAPAIARGAASQSLANFTSEGASRVQSKTLTALQSIRMRMYGYTQPSLADVYAIRNTEEAVFPKVSTDDQGRGTFSGDLVEIWKDTCRYFGLAASDSTSESRWRLWFQYRFLPTYTTFLGQLNLQAGLKTEDGLERQTSAAKLYAIAQNLVGISGVWDVDVMPLAKMAANTDPKCVDEIMAALKAEADKQKAQEAKYKPPVQTQSQINDQTKSAAQTPARDYPSSAQLQTTRFSQPDLQKQPNTMPDMEGEPKGTGSAVQGIKPPPQVGSLVQAPGELANGGDGMQFVKAPSKQSIDGLHPEVKRLFLGMAEEYGNLTQQSIKVNRGFVTREEQAEQYNKTPEKAAPPGSSPHEFGMAIDIDSVDANRLEKLGLMRKYGFTRPIGGETWHLEPAGIQHDVRGLRNNPAAAAQAIAASVGRGGGGVGSTKTGFRLGGRDTEYALKVRDGQTQELKPAAGGYAGAIATARASVDQGANAPVQGSGGGGTGLVGPQGVGGGMLYASLPVAQNRDDAKALVAKAAEGVGVDPKQALTTVALESGFRTNVKAGTGNATGLNQFTKGTWSDMMKRYAKDYGIPPDTSPSDPRANAILGAKYLQDNLQKAERTGMPKDISSAYLMHFMGPSGGKKAMELPEDAIMANVFPEAAANNKPIFYTENGTPRTKAQFMELIRNKINRAAKDFGISDQLITDQPSGDQKPYFPKPANRPVEQGASYARPSGPVPSVYSQTAPQFQDRTVTPSTSPVESGLLKAVTDGTMIAQKQLDTQMQILDQVKLLVSMASQVSQGTGPAATKPAQEPVDSLVSREQRTIRTISPPSYRTTSI